MNPTLFDPYESAWQEIFKQWPPLTAVQGAARRAADEALRASYPLGYYLAYTDTWRGDELDRAVLVATADWEEYQRQMNALPPDARARLRMDRVRDPEEGVRLRPRLVEGE